MTENKSNSVMKWLCFVIQQRDQINRYLLIILKSMNGLITVRWLELVLAIIDGLSWSDWMIKNGNNDGNGNGNNGKLCGALCRVRSAQLSAESEVL